MDKEKREKNAQRGKRPDLGQGGKTAEGQEGKAGRRGQHGQQSQGPDFPGRVGASCFVRTVQKQQVGDAVINREGEDCPPEADGHHRDGGLENRINEKRQHRSDDGGQQRQQADQRPWESDQQHDDNGDGRKNDGPLGSLLRTGFIVQGRPVGADRRQNNGFVLPAALIELRADDLHQGRRLPGKRRIRSRFQWLGDDQQMSVVGGNQLPLVNLCVAGGRQMRQTRQDQVPQVQGVLGNQGGLADAVQLAQLPEMRDKMLPDFIRLESRSDLLRQFRGREKNRQAAGDGKDKLRKLLLLPPQADATEKPALYEPLLNEPRDGNQSVAVCPRQTHVDNHTVLDGMMGNDAAGVRQNGVILRQGGHEVGIEGQPLQGNPEKPGNGQNDESDEPPS